MVDRRFLSRGPWERQQLPELAAHDRTRLWPVSDYKVDTASSMTSWAFLHVLVLPKPNELAKPYSPSDGLTRWPTERRTDCRIRAGMSTAGP